jgi:hypothetical protein
MLVFYLEVGVTLIISTGQLLADVESKSKKSNRHSLSDVPHLLSSVGLREHKGLCTTLEFSFIWQSRLQLQAADGANKGLCPCASSRDPGTCTREPGWKLD